MVSLDPAGEAHSAPTTPWLILRKGKRRSKGSVGGKGKEKLGKGENEYEWKSEFPTRFLSALEPDYRITGSLPLTRSVTRFF